MLNQTYRRLLRTLRAAEVGVLVEDDYADFKNFFAKWKEPILESTCTVIEIILRDPSSAAVSSQGVEFIILFYTSKNRVKQRQLSSCKFKQLKHFIATQLFAPIGMTVTGFFDIKRDYKTNHVKTLFINRVPGVIIIVGGIAKHNNTSGGKYAVSTR